MGFSTIMCILFKLLTVKISVGIYIYFIQLKKIIHRNKMYIIFSKPNINILMDPFYKI